MSVASALEGIWKGKTHLSMINILKVYFIYSENLKSKRMNIVIIFEND